MRSRCLPTAPAGGAHREESRRLPGANGPLVRPQLHRELEQINGEFLQSEEGAAYAGIDRLSMESLVNPKT